MNFKKIPFTYHWIYTQVIGKAGSILDLGCGDGSFTQDIAKEEKWKITGVELYKDSITLASQKKIYRDLIKADVTKIPKNFKSDFDVVIASQVIEHLPKKIGLKSLERWENLGKKIIISTPVGFIPFHRIEDPESEKNPLQKHLSGWLPSEFKKRGYKVYGQGIKFIYGKNGLGRRSPKILLPLFGIVSFIFAPVAYFYPEMGTYFIAVKQNKTKFGKN